MAYKKYIQRNGKLYGPYIYQSKRVDGKVVSEYYGSDGNGNGGDGNHRKPKRNDSSYIKNYKKLFLILLGLIFLAVLVYLIGFSGKEKITGGVVLGLDTSYESGKPLQGVLRFSLKDGELLPSSSKVVFENAGKTYEFTLGEILDSQSVQGDYYLVGENITGSGQGYGVEGEKIIYPEVDFTLQIYSESTTTEENTSTNESIPEETNSTEENPSQEESTPTAEETTPETPSTTATTNTETTTTDNSAPLTGEVVNNGRGGFFSSLFGLTGMVSMQLESEIQGSVSKDNPFVYNLNQGESAEVVPNSVNVNGKEMNDNTISIEVQDNEVTVTTDYSEVDKGYGADYVVGDSENTLSLDLSNLNLVLEEGGLNVSLVYGDSEILHVSTTLKEGEKTSDEITNTKEDNLTIIQINETPTEEPNSSIETIVNASMWDIGDFLTDNEKKVLMDNFGNAPLESVKYELVGDRLIRGYKLGEYYIEFSYDSSLNPDVLDVQMEKDRIKFFKDLANSLSRENPSPETLEEYNQNYSI